MLSVADAQSLILQHAQPREPQVTHLNALLLGMILAEDVVSDIDMPPHDKSMMDGYAIRSADLAAGQCVLNVIEEVTAGQTPHKQVGSGQATRIMTGAPIPVGADAVVQVERTRMLDEQRVQIDDKPPASGKNILPQGREIRRGETILQAGTPLLPPVMGLLATAGRTSARVYPPPVVAVISTGDEIVEAPQVPGPGQIRNSNGAMLIAQISRAGTLFRYLGIARDREDSLQPLIKQGLQADVLVLSGGVSAGKLDLVPKVLQELGVEPHFHKVEMKPGKPVFFGTRTAEKTTGSASPLFKMCLVFGLAGNPVGSLVGFELFVRTAIRRLMGHAEPLPQFVPMPLAADFPYASDRPTYHPARVELSSEGWQVRPVPWFGSADLRALAQTDALVLFPAGDHQHRAGQMFPVLKT